MTVALLLVAMYVLGWISAETAALVYIVWWVAGFIAVVVERLRGQ